MFHSFHVILLFLSYPIQSTADSECRGYDCDTLIIPERDVQIPDIERKVTKYCAPDMNGMVGVKSDKGYILPYAFGIETIPDSPLHDILTSLRLSVQSFLIGKYFPEKCVNVPIRRELERNKVQGLSFRHEIEPIAGKSYVFCRNYGI
jgi:hypothetical protein